MELFGLDPIQIRGALIQSCGARFEERAGLPTLCHIQGLKLQIRDIVDLFLTDEIFRGFSYPVPITHPCVVFDVGMNAGFTSLEFARHPQVQAVYGYEPFPRTFQMALENFRLNPELAHKIFPFCCGLAVKDETRTIMYSENLRAGMTTTGIPETHFSLGLTAKETIELKEITQSLKATMQKHENLSLILKMDCEGDEFELIPRLHESHLLERFDLIMIEFHRQDPDPLLEILATLGYQFTSAIRSEQILFQGKVSNMIYAAKDPALLN